MYIFSEHDCKKKGKHKKKTSEMFELISKLFISNYSFPWPPFFYIKSIAWHKNNAEIKQPSLIREMPEKCSCNSFFSKMENSHTADIFSLATLASNC